MRITHNRLRRLIQGVALAAFAWVALLMPWLAGAETVGCWGRWFLQLDPVVSLSAALASRTWSVAVIPAAICLLICFLISRGFCVYVCPMGTVIDLTDGMFKRLGLRAGAVVLPRLLRRIRFFALAAVTGAALGGVLLTTFVAPLVILNRAGMAVVRLPRVRALAPGAVPVALLWTYGGAMLLCAAIMLCGGLASRFWCRCLCPSGALLSLVPSLREVRRRVSAVCRRHGTETDRKRSGLSRREFIGVGGAGAMGLAFGRMQGCGPTMIRPPGSVPESFFVSRCVGCGACMQVCPTGVLQPAGQRGGALGLWSPRADTTLSGCERTCNACGHVCPTGAIRRLPAVEKQAARMGLAVVNRRTCLPHAGREACQLCVEQCRASGYDAIEFVRVGVAVNEDGMPDEHSGTLAPVIASDRCSGCGQCEARCHQLNVAERHLLTEAAIQVKTGEGMQDRLLDGSYIRKPEAVEVPGEDSYLPKFLQDM